MTGLKPEYLGKKVAKLVKKKRPAYNYIIASPLQKLAIILKTLLPQRFFAWILGKFYGL